MTFISFDNFQWQERGFIYKVLESDPMHGYLIGVYSEAGELKKHVTLDVGTMYHKVLIRTLALIDTAIGVFQDHEHYQFFVEEYLKHCLEKVERYE